MYVHLKIKDKLHDNDIKEILNLLTVSELHYILCKLKKVCWCGNQTLKELYPELFACSLVSESSISSMLVEQPTVVVWSWDICFH